MQAHIDFVTANSMGQGEVASRLLQEGRLNVNSMRPWMDPQTGRSYITVFVGGDPKKPENYKSVPVTTNATLRRDEWKMLDDAVLRVAESRLVGVQDLKSRGLTYNIPNGMGTTVLEYHDVSDALSAEMTMDGVTRAQGDRPRYATNYMPLPIIHVDYELNERVLQASRRMGNPLDTTLAERAARKVSEQMENLLFTSTSYTYGGGTIYSLLNHPDRNQVTLSTYGSWSNDSSTTAAEILEMCRAMKQAAINSHHYGPYVMYIPSAYESRLDDDYDTSGTSTQTIRDRILKINGIEDIKVIDTLPTDNVLLVEMNSDVARWVNGMGIQNVQWSTEGGMVHKFKVMTIQVPQIRSDQIGQSGVVHAA